MFSSVLTFEKFMFEKIITKGKTGHLKMSIHFLFFYPVDNYFIVCNTMIVIAKKAGQDGPPNKFSFFTPNI